MKWNSKVLGIVAASVACTMSLTPSAIQAGDFYKPFRFLKQPFEAAHREKPATEKDNSIEQLANEIDWLEHHIDKYGSIVAKHPDIWGQSRLMRHRYEYEKEMEAQINRFEVRMNGALRRSDQAFLGMAFALQAASGSRPNASGTGTIPTPIPDASQTNTYLTNLNAMIPSTNQAVGSEQNTVIQRTQPFATAANSPVPGFTFNQPNISLEPTTQLDQMSRYLNHLHELRRINEGDDIADSPGYSLNLVRIPVSVLPGKQTQKGYGAEVTIIAEPYLSEDLLPSTMRNMVINDTVDMLAPVLTCLANDEGIRQTIRDEENKLRALLEKKRNMSEGMGDNEKVQKDQPPGSSKAVNQIRNMGIQQLRATISSTKAASDLTDGTNQEALKGSKKFAKDISNSALRNMSQIHASSTNSRRARLPIPMSQVHEVLGQEQFSDLLIAVVDRFESHPASQPMIAFVDVRAYLREELEASYDFLKGDEFRKLWDFCGPELSNAIRERKMRWLDERRCHFFNCICSDTRENAISANGGPLGQLPHCIPEIDCPNLDRDDFLIRFKVTARLAWALIVESALLNERLMEDMREAAISKGCHCVPDQCGPFYGPYPTPEACQAFNEYVRCRWPVRVFALDPVEQDQNIADAYARRREEQVAVALAFASGQMNAQSMMRFTRRLEWDMATIDINRTSVGFSHGTDTFGWRFHPRFQTPPVKGSLSTFGETLFGGPTTNSDIRSRHLEAGMRECTAIVVMPSFVPYMTFDVRTNWFKLTNPKCTEISMKETLTLSRSIQTMKQSAAACAPCSHLYRDGEVHRLLRRVDQLDRELPLQTMQAQIPYENTSGGFELFNTGITDLAPELIGWYGAPGVNPNGATTLYLIGKGFSVHSTQLIAGGRNLPFNLISRQVMQVEVPPGAQVLQRSQEGEGRLDQVVDIHLATPYGVSGHLLVPVAKAGAATSRSGGQFAWRPGSSITITETVGAKVGNADQVISPSKYFSTSHNALLIDVPSACPIPAAIKVRYFIHDTNGTFIGTFDKSGMVFDTAGESIVVGGADLNSLIDPLASGDSIGFLVKEYLNWLVNKNQSKVTGLSLRVTAAFDPSNSSRPLLPIDGGFDVSVIVKTE